MALVIDTGFSYDFEPEPITEERDQVTPESPAVRIAGAFLSARSRCEGLADYPGAVPQTLDEGYAIQDAAIAAAGERIAGWKVGRILPPLSDRLGADRLSGPIFARTIRDAAPDAAGMIFPLGFGAAEAEFLLRIGTPPPKGKLRFTLEEAADHIEAVHIGLEIASSPLGQINSLGPAVTISDFGNNNGLVIGAAVPGWRDRAFEDLEVALTIDGALAGTGRARAFPDGAVGSARFLLENLAARGIALESGSWISSGAITGVHEVTTGQSIVGDFGPLGSVSCVIAAEQPR